MVDRADIQGIVLHGYRRAPFARYHLLRFGAGEPRRWLTRIVADVSSAGDRLEPIRQNLGLTASGLAALGLSSGEMAQFSREFRQGMAHPERSRVLGDRGDSSPEHWEFGAAGAELDALLMTYAELEADLHERCARTEARLRRFGIAWHVENAHLNRAGEPAPLDASSRKKAKRVPWGEFVLGYRDAVGERHRGPFVALKWSARPLPTWSKSQNALNFGENGTYLVVRKLEARTEIAPESRAELERDHARRARGPGDWSSHRLLRRSRFFGPPGPPNESHAAGLWFMACNADLRRQFEFVQENYLNVPREPGNAGSVDIARLMRVRGGGYFFLPGIRALNYLAESAG